MGTLVFGTLHTNGTANTIDRLIDAFPADQQAQVRITLSESLSAVVSQLLLPTADGKGRVAVNEILLKTPGLPNVIREGNTPMIRSIIQGSRADGMVLMDDALAQLVDKGTIRGRDAHSGPPKARFEQYLGESRPPAPPADLCFVDAGGTCVAYHRVDGGIIINRRNVPMMRNSAGGRAVALVILPRRWLALLS